MMRLLTKFEGASGFFYEMESLVNMVKIQVEFVPRV